MRYRRLHCAFFRNRNFEESHVGQFLTVYPMVYLLRFEKHMDKYTRLPTGRYVLVLTPNLRSGGFSISPSVLPFPCGMLLCSIYFMQTDVCFGYTIFLMFGKSLFFTNFNNNTDSSRSMGDDCKKTFSSFGLICFCSPNTCFLFKIG